jgi:hypothetical protein
VDDIAYEELFERLGADEDVPSKVTDCLLAAADGPDALAAILAGGATAVPRAIEISDGPSEVPRVFLEEIAVTGFRGIADRARLPLAPGPGLTLVVGRNGSGKSSFAEGLELLLTGRNLRWEDKPKSWREGWRNLHASGATKLEARFRIDGDTDPLLVTQTLPADGSLNDLGPAQVSGARPDWDALGWDEPLARYRPLLSYNELGTMFSDRASELYDALSAILGLEAFDGVQAVLRDARLSHQKSGKAEKDTRRALKTVLAAATDERAQALLAQIATTHPDLDGVQDSLHNFSSDDDLAALQRLQRLPLPDLDRITDVLGRSTARMARSPSSSAPTPSATTGSASSSAARSPSTSSTGKASRLARSAKPRMRSTPAGRCGPRPISVSCASTPRNCGRRGRTPSPPAGRSKRCSQTRRRQRSGRSRSTPPRHKRPGTPGSRAGIRPMRRSRYAMPSPPPRRLPIPRSPRATLRGGPSKTRSSAGSASPAKRRVTRTSSQRSSRPRIG